jgi:predicted enzyme related to lactoylglutathione lyase
MTAIAALDYITVDAGDPARLARFYSAVLDLPVADEGDDYAQLAPFVAGGGPSLLFLQVPDVKGGKNRLHLDLRVDDVPAATRRCEDLGATRVTEGPLAGPFQWQVMLDPEGNEFCLCPPMSGG